MQRDFESKLAGRDFVASFLKRQKIILVRKPKELSLNRVFGLNKNAVQQYFENLTTLLDEHMFSPDRIRMIVIQQSINLSKS